MALIKYIGILMREVCSLSIPLWHVQVGIPYVKSGRSVRYSLTDVIELATQYTLVMDSISIRIPYVSVANSPNSE